MKSYMCVWAGMLLFSTPAHGQAVSAADQQVAARMDAVARAVSRAGYRGPMVAGHGEGAMDSLFALIASRGDSGAVVAVLETRGGAAVHPAELERDRTPAALAVRGVQFAPFLGAPDLYDMTVNHVPMQLETSYHFETHYVLRRLPDRVELVCQFAGSSESSSSKGMGSVTGSRQVTVVPASGGFRVTTIEATIERAGSQSAPVTTAHSETSRQYELPASGACREMTH